jgi:hypothetical protein
MKAIKLIPALLLTSLCLPPTHAFAQNNEDVLKERDVLIEKRAEKLHEQELALQAVADAERTVEQNVKNVERQLRYAQSTAAVNRDGKPGWRPEAGGSGGGAGGDAFAKTFGIGVANSMESPLIVSTTPLDAAALTELREDIAVMGKLLNNEVADNRDEASVHRAMGILVNWLPGGGATENLYIDGHGVILQTAVRFPLSAPKKEEAAKPEETPKNTAWESARRELFGGPQREESEMVLNSDRKEEYDAERVEKLKKDILKALANASNFRRLGGDETVTAVVRSRTGARSQAFVFKTTGGGKARTSNSDSGSSTMTIRVKKADADALAGGKITEDEFRKRARIAIY